MRGNSFRTSAKAASGRLLVVLLVLVVLLTTTTGVLLVYSHRQRQLNETVQETLTAVQQEKEQQESQLQEQEQQIQEKEQQLQDKEQQLQDKEQQLQDKDKKLQEQENTISDLNKQLVMKKNQATATKPVTTTTTTTTTAHNPPQSDGRKLVALTFDDGPGPYTAKLLDAMKQRGIRATFFVLGSRVNSYPDLIRRMEAEGHVVGNHSTNHKNLKYLSASQMATEIETCSKRVEALIGHGTTVLRCPGGNYNAAVTNYAKSVGLPIIQWSVDTRDWESRNVNKILSTAFQSGAYGIRDGSIVLMHDIYSTSVEAAIQMMDRLQAEGYELVTVPELLNARYGGMTAGQVYRSAA